MQVVLWVKFQTQGQKTKKQNISSTKHHHEQGEEEN
jgi:hypothetical protein